MFYVNITKHCSADWPREHEKNIITDNVRLQGDQLNMAGLFLYLEKRDLSRVGYW